MNRSGENWSDSFEWRACSGADELADATIDRVIRGLVGEKEIRATDPGLTV
jgi:hypothetical protein